MDNLDTFVVKHIMTFLDNGELFAISEVCKNFNDIEFQFKIPKKKLIYSSVSYLEYAYDHEYTKFSYIYAISHNLSIDILDWLYPDSNIALPEVDILDDYGVITLIFNSKESV